MFYGLAKPYGDIDIGQHWLQTIDLINVDLEPVSSIENKLKSVT